MSIITELKKIFLQIPFNADPQTQNNWRVLSDELNGAIDKANQIIGMINNGTIGGGTPDTYKAKVSADDTIANYLDSKILGGTGIIVATHLGGADEHLDISTSITQYTDEMAQDAVGVMVSPTIGTSSLVYVDATPSLDTIQDIRTSASPTFANLYLGINDTARGIISLYGPATGTEFGGTVICYTGVDHDTTIQNYGFMVFQDDLYIGPDSNTDALKLDSNDDFWVTNGSIVLPASEYLNFGGTLGTTGYGFFDDAGHLFYKDSGGTWIEFNTFLTSVTAHSLLSATHGDTVASTVARGDIIIGSTATPKWDNLAVGASTTYLNGGTEPAWKVPVAADITIPSGYGTPTYDDLQDFLKETRSAGRITGGVVTAHAGPNGTVDISEMEGMIFETNALGGVYKFFKMPAATAGLALTDLSVNWIYFDYNGGTPRYLATVSRSDIHEYDQFTVGRVWVSGNNVDVLATGHSLYDKDRRSHNRLILKYGSMDRVSGGILSQHTTALRIQTDAGSWYVANTPYTTSAADTFKVIYKTGGSATWVEGAAVTLFSDVFDGAGGHKVYESYQNGSNIGTLSAGRYGVYWVFMSPLGVLFVVMDSVNTGSIATAQAATVPASLPARCINWARLVGRVICKKGDAALYSVESSFSYSFTLSAAVDHASLSNLTAADSHPQAAITGLTTVDGPTFNHIHADVTLCPVVEINNTEPIGRDNGHLWYDADGTTTGYNIDVLMVEVFSGG